ncbi:Ferric siderophore transport system, periplasmic binding protein TonB [hydrothermal vent metagenome]|uniref:Ferric siderophore transport system, periplasmic binding protein TonB n=1 Tax=hydrothermal vent metagenome TaxID=652676 RepID=A0A1W1CPG2_9ZZZZ
MNRSTFALFVALLIHLLFVLLFWILGTLSPEAKNPKLEEQKIKISLKELPKKHKESGLNKNKTKPQKEAPPMPKGKQLKEIVELPVKYEPKKTKKTPKLNKPKIKPKPQTKPKPKVEPLPPVKPFIPLIEKKKDVNKTKKTKNDDPLAWMLEDKSDKEEKKVTKKVSNGGNISQDIKELYGEEFGKLTPGQQQYIINNQEIMRRITQQVLSRVARVNLPRDLNVNRSNVIEFYLHPNGDMTDFKFLSKSGYYVLDDTTKETIEYAYSRYPRPKEKTLIRYNVYYHLARY